MQNLISGIKCGANLILLTKRDIKTFYATSLEKTILCFDNQAHKFNRNSSKFTAPLAFMVYVTNELVSQTKSCSPYTKVQQKVRRQENNTCALLPSPPSASTISNVCRKSAGEIKTAYCPKIMSTRRLSFLPASVELSYLSDSPAPITAMR